jgi:hypothetical protein
VGWGCRDEPARRQVGFIWTAEAGGVGGDLGGGGARDGMGGGGKLRGDDGVGDGR